MYKSDIVLISDYIYTKMNLKTKIGFGFGHVLNDLCASMWFTYLLVYFSKVRTIDRWIDR